MPSQGLTGNWVRSRVRATTCNSTNSRSEGSMNTTKRQGRVHSAAFVTGCLLILASGSAGRAQQQHRQAVDHNGAPLFRVDPFWPKPLPNRWSMQQITGVFVDREDHIWFLNRAAKADPDEVGGDNNRIDCCIRGPELIELDQEGKVVRSWGGRDFHPLWPTALQTVLVDRQGVGWGGWGWACASPLSLRSRALGRGGGGGVGGGGGGGRAAAPKKTTASHPH